MTSVGLISDTHDHLPDEAIELLRGSDRIIHAGDICKPNILWELECVAPVIAVLGNNDHLDYGTSVRPIARCVIDGCRFVVAHKPEDLKVALRNLDPSEGLPVIGVHGHKHVPNIEISSLGKPFDIMISPGSVFRSREQHGKKTIGKIDIEDGIITARIIELTGEIIAERSLPAADKRD